MNVLVVIFGGLDVEFLSKWQCENLCQKEWGPVVVDELHNERDVATQITAQFITGKTWRENGVGDRKKQFIRYKKPLIRWIENRLLANVSKGLPKRRGIYQSFRWADVTEREYLKHDLTCPSIFDRVPGSQAVYVPAYNPEPSWALDRNILDPRRYPELGVEAAVDLLEKNFSWRRRRFLTALDAEPRPLLMAQFQDIDSAQHLWLDYVTPPDEDAVGAVYRKMDRFAGEIKERASGRYDRILFVSDNGAARKDGFRPTHYNRPFYSVDTEVGLERPNIRDFHNVLLQWIAEEPNTHAVDD